MKINIIPAMARKNPRTKNRKITCSKERNVSFKRAKYEIVGPKSMEGILLNTFLALKHSLHRCSQIVIDQAPKNTPIKLIFRPLEF